MLGSGDTKRYYSQEPSAQRQDRRKASHFSGVEYVALRDRCEQIWRWHEGRNHQLVQEGTGAGVREILEDMNAKLGLELEKAKWTEGHRTTGRRQSIYKGMTV